LAIAAPELGSEQKHTFLLAVGFGRHLARLPAADTDAGFTSSPTENIQWLENGNENTNTWSSKTAHLMAHGERCHLYYVAMRSRSEFRAQSGRNDRAWLQWWIIFIQYQNQWPKQGFESQVNRVAWRLDQDRAALWSGELAPRQQRQSMWTQHIIVKGTSVTVKFDGKTVLEYNEPPGAKAGTELLRKLDSGLRVPAHDPKSIVRYKNVRVKRLD